MAAFNFGEYVPRPLGTIEALHPPVEFAAVKQAYVEIYLNVRRADCSARSSQAVWSPFPFVCPLDADGQTLM